MFKIIEWNIQTSFYKLKRLQIWSTGNPGVITLFAVKSVKRGVCEMKTGYLQIEDTHEKMRKDAKKSKKSKMRNADGKNK